MLQDAPLEKVCVDKCIEEEAQPALSPPVLSQCLASAAERTRKVTSGHDSVHSKTSTADSYAQSSFREGYGYEPIVVVDLELKNSRGGRMRSKHFLRSLAHRIKREQDHLFHAMGLSNSCWIIGGCEDTLTEAKSF